MLALVDNGLHVLSEHLSETRKTHPHTVGIRYIYDGEAKESVLVTGPGQAVPIIPEK